MSPTAAVPAAPERAADPLDLRSLAIDECHPSKTNPRTHFDDAYLDEIGASIATNGLLQPLTVRPRKAGGFEIVCGECRWRGAKRKGVTALAAIVRAYTDEQVLDAQLIENMHRQDLTPLEQAVGYRRLIATNPDKHSAATIAQRIGMSEVWVWDRLKLNDLIPDAKAILDQARMAVGHAILLARLKPEHQTRAITVDGNRMRVGTHDGLWRDDHGLDFDEDDPAHKGKKPGKYDGLKACSVRELEAWIQRHVRFDVDHAAKAQPLVFEETAAKVAAAAAQPGRGRKVIAITHEYRVADDARDENERTYGSESWQRADGQEKSKTCDHSVLGVVAAGTGYGDTLEVCVARDKCRVHFGDVIRKKEKTATLRESGKGTQADRREAAEEARAHQVAAEHARTRARWDKFGPALRKAVHEAVSKLKAVNGPIYAQVLKFHHLPSTKPANLPRVLLDQAIKLQFDRHMWAGDEARYVAWAKVLGVDVKALEPEAPKAAEPAPTKKAAKPAAATKPGPGRR